VPFAFFLLPLCASKKLMLAALLFALALAAPGEPTSGLFKGKLVREHCSPATVYVQARNGSLRKVNVGRAQITYSREVAAAKRDPDPADGLRRANQVLVTAVQDDAGEWTASRIEILSVNSGAPAKENCPKQSA
jgi:hypothetical protein